MSENNCAVYVHVNLINGKKYFGITIQEPEKRWKNGSGYSNNAHFTNAINKYGWENFAHFILYKDIPIKIAKNIEEMLIKEHMSYDPRLGYNRTYGGELEKHTKETRRKMSKSHKGLKQSEEARKKISDAMKGREISEEWRQKISDAQPNRRSVEAIDHKTGERVYYFESTMSAERSGFNRADIRECCNGKRKTHKGYVWRYAKEVNDDDSDN